LLTIKEYAESQSVSYEAIRKQLVQYESELQDHIHTVKRKKYLDDTAINFLDEHRKGNPVIVQQADQQEELEELRNENKNLLLQLNSKSEQLLILQQQIIEMQQELIPDKRKSLWSRLTRKKNSPQ